MATILVIEDSDVQRAEIRRALEPAGLFDRILEAADGLAGLRILLEETVDVGEWRSTVASRKNDDGSISFITIDPTISGFEFVVTEKEGKRALVIRDDQHEYVFLEGTAKPSTEARAG